MPVKESGNEKDLNVIFIKVMPEFQSIYHLSDILYIKTKKCNGLFGRRLNEWVQVNLLIISYMHIV